jgi:hypothetical protein
VEAVVFAPVRGEEREGRCGEEWFEMGRDGVLFEESV